MTRPEPGAIGAAEPAHRSRRLLNGRGRYVADVRVAGCLEAAMVRSAHAHARIRAVDVEAARDMPGVVAVFTGADVATVAAAYAGTSLLYPDLRAPAQRAVATETAMWSGEAVAVVVARSRGEAEDAAEAVLVDYEPLTAVATAAAALDPAVPAMHADRADNVAWRGRHQRGDAAAAFAAAAHVVERRFRFPRHTGVPLEPRGILADFEPGERRLTVHLSHQCPHQMQVEYARLLGLDEHKVRVICPDVGGAFGIKQQLSGDELATCAASMLLGRPVRFLADRLESMLSDVHAREHEITARIAVAADGRILGFAVDDVFAIGPYSQYPRSSMGETRTVVGLCGAPYRFDSLDAATTVVFQNKAPSGHYRGVGHPIACALTEGLVEAAARAVGLDPREMRRRNFIGRADLPYAAPNGTTFERLAFPECLAALEAAIDIPALEAEIAAARAAGRLMGVGFAAFVEQTSRGPAFYGNGGVPITTRDGCVVRLEPSGVFRCLSSVTEQGQGTEMGVRQVVAAALGVATADVEVLTGDTAISHHGGGTWGSRSMAIGGEAAWRAARVLRAEILAIAADLTQRDAGGLAIRGREIVAAATGEALVGLAELAAIAHFRPHELPGGRQPQLVATAAFGPLDAPFRAGCGIQMSVVEIDAGLGAVRLARHVVVHECGRVVNPLLADEQIRGGVVQGIGAALFEECLYDEDGQFRAGTLADYLVPMAAEIPDIELVHAEGQPLAGDGLGIVGVGEAGTVGAAAAVMNAVNDALAPLGRTLTEMPFTPDRVLRALGTI